MFDQHTLALIFVGLMALAVLLYAVLDGYDLGVGILLPLDNREQADQMISSIGPFWDANETWLVLAIGLLLIAFPSAHSMVLKALYLPTALMLICLILRGVAFDFRTKAAVRVQKFWDLAFKLGSLGASLCQGFMLGMFVMGLEYSMQIILFSLAAAVGVTCAYVLIGACWLIMKTSDTLQLNAIKAAQKSLLFGFIGVVLVSILNPLVNASVFSVWFTFPNYLFLLPLPFSCLILFVLLHLLLKRLPLEQDQFCWLPFTMTLAIFVLCFAGIGISFFPDIVPGKLTIYQAVSAAESLNFLLYGALVVIPCILGYTAFSYRVFWGKASQLHYY